VSKPIRIDSDVEIFLRRNGAFGQTYSDVLRRLLSLPTRKKEKRLAGRSLYRLLGYSACAVIRWMRDHGWSFAEVRKVMDSYSVEVSDKTIECQLQENREGSPAKLTADQAKELNIRRRATAS
jgi:DNA-binding transcriptional MerR regulator